MAKEIISSESGSTHLIPEKNMMVMALEQPKKAPSDPVEKQNNTPNNIAMWGDSNDYPREIYDQAKLNSIIPSTIEWKARTIRSGGIIYGVMERDEKGKKQFIPITHPEIEEFLEFNDMDSYLEESLSDLFWFGHMFPELNLRADRKKIVSLVHQEAMFVRFKKQNPKNGKIASVILNANWPEYKKETSREIPIVDRYWNPAGEIREGNAFKYIFPLSYSSPGRVYYQEPSWHSLIHGKWLDVANKIPEFKSYLMNNQMSIKYMVHIPMEWWEWKYPGFNTQGKFTATKRKEIMKKELEFFNKALTGVEKVGKALMMVFKTDSQGKAYTKWDIQILKDKKESGEYIEESQEASSHILYALAVDGTLIGNTPGKQMGAGSGSDKRIAWNIFIMNNKPFQDKVLAPLDLITTFNGWTHNNQKIMWRFNNYLIATLDQGKETQSE
jgi:hypothetical protein